MFFSVVVPVYNTENYLHKCVNSIMDQTFGDFEVILVDDGSQDRSGSICDEYMGKNRNVKVIHKENGGATSARKAAARVAEGRYIVPVDSDDWVSRDLLYDLHKVLLEYAVDILCYDFCRVSEKETVFVRSQYREGYYNRLAIEKEILPSLIRGIDGKRFSGNLCTKAIRRELFVTKQMLIDDRIKIGEDACVAWACIGEAESIYILKKNLYFYRKNVGSVTENRESGYPWSDVWLCIKFVKENLPIKKYDMEDQIYRHIVHTLFIIANSWLRTNIPYTIQRQRILNQFNKLEYQEAIRKCRYKGNIKEWLATMAVRYRLIWLIKIYSQIS